MAHVDIGNIVQLEYTWLNICILNGYIKITADKYVHFFKNNCYSNPKIGDKVQVKYNQVSINETEMQQMHMPTRFRAEEITKISAELLAKAADKIYKQTDGTVLLNSSNISMKKASNILRAIESTSESFVKEYDTVVENKLNKIENCKRAQIAFLVDCTGSMDKYIRQLKQIKSLQQYIADHITGSIIEFAFVGYRDYLEEEPIIIDFTSSLLHFEHYIQDLNAYGGGDVCEDVYSGLYKVTYSISWRPYIATKIILFIADAPTHGTFFAKGNLYNDDDPNHDYDGYRTQKILQDMHCNKHIKMFFFKINDSTNEMIKSFNKLLNPALSDSDKLAPISTINLNNDKHIISCAKKTIVDTMTKEFTNTLSRPLVVDSIHKFCSKINTILEESDKSSIDNTKLFQTVPYKSGAQYVQIIRYKPPNTFAELREPLARHNTEIRHMIIDETKMLNKGGVRYVYTATDVTDSNTNYLFKVHQSFNSTFEDEYKVRIDLQIQQIARFLAQQFSKNSKCSKAVRYIESFGVQYKDHNGNIRFASIESKLHGTYIKWSNNNDYLMNMTNNEWSATMETFTHWTYHITDGYIMITDIQGIYQSGEFILTDPAIHCLSKARFGNTNLSEKGMNLFFEKHKCNQICKALKLHKNQKQTYEIINQGTLIQN